VKLLPFVFLKSVILTFVHTTIVVKLVLAPIKAGAKDLWRVGIHVDEHVIGGGSASTRDPPVQVETALTHDITVCDVALVSRSLGLSTAMLSVVC
jgi:hypothetical protein